MFNTRRAVARSVAIKDLQALARKHLPKAIYDFIEGGCDEELCLETNERAFRDIRLVPRCLIDVTSRDQRKSIFGQDFSSPFGIAPTGLIGLYRHDGERMLVKAASAANIPFVLSGAGTLSYADVQHIWPKSWAQLYIPEDDAIWRRKLVAAEKSGFSTLVVTVDVPATSKRERNAKRGWTLSTSAAPSFTMMLDALRRPLWTYAFLRHGLPFLEAWREFCREGATARETVARFASQCPAGQDWRRLQDIRDAWNGRLVVKGILSADDAVAAVEHGADGIVVSNHGGRQLDHAVASIDMLPVIADAVAGRSMVMIDSGIRRGADIVASLALGADMALVGRATLYGLVGGGYEGAKRAIDILRQEIDLCMAQTGLTSLEAVPRTIVR